MKTGTILSKAEYLDHLETEFHKKLKKDQVETIVSFARHWFLNLPEEELVCQALDDVYGKTLNAWKFIQQFSPDQPKINLFNPDFETHHWQSSHTVVMVLHMDSPFLVDSVRMELSRREIGVHGMQSIVYQTLRDTDGRLIDQKSCNYEEGCAIGDKDYKTEAFMYFEVDRLTGDKTLTEISLSLAEVLADVEVVVSDFVPMQEEARKIIAHMDKGDFYAHNDEVKEARAYLEWMLDQNFIFLGFKEYKLTKRKDKTYIQHVDGRELGIVKRKHRSQKSKFTDELPASTLEYVERPRLLGFSKSGTLSRVHRPAYPDYVSIRKYSKTGKLVGTYGFLGLYTLSVYTGRTRSIPVLRRKVEEVMQRSGLYSYSYEGKQLAKVLETFPRQELLQMDVDELFDSAVKIAQIKERHQIRVFVRQDHYSKFYSCLVYMPREIYNTDVREKIQEIFCKAFKAINANFTTTFGESVLVCIHFVLRTDPNQQIDYDVAALQQAVIDVSRSWQDQLLQGLIDKYGEEQGIIYGRRFQSAFPAGYRDHFSPRLAVADVHHILSISDKRPLNMWFYQKFEESESEAHFSLYHRGEPLPLSDIIPILENMGLKVMGEHPYKIIDKSGQVTWNHDFSLIYRLGDKIEADQYNQIFTEAFEHIWKGVAANDNFNRLILAAGVDWRSVAYLRSCARYAKQIGLGLSQEYMADTLLKHLDVTRNLVEYFIIKFDPELQLTLEEREAKLEFLEKKHQQLLDNVPSLSEDKILQRFLQLNKAATRTNFYQRDDRGIPKEYFSYKIDSRQVPDIPMPCPRNEIFVYSSHMEGVHLRGGKVARGGLRWSDRLEDYRTEVLGLVKAQQVKNAVIVPVGAKGGFVLHLANQLTDKDELLAEGISCYQTFIRGLLDLTDNLVDGKVVPPLNVVRYDEDDPYLVVAADKGTATFSDISNALAKEYGFWLGDAFASGGSQGYDHKGMGITARGAWISVQRHFRELNIDVQTTDFTVVGIGGMSGDVFGNGMLLSKHIHLVAAFDHRHIFIDPDPVATSSYAERKRLFKLPRSGWNDYKSSLISEGGGVFLRNVKSITISPQMQSRFNISAPTLTPNELIRAMLCAQVDLLWNGGIGTYIKSSSETDVQVSDKANDPVRINGAELGARVVGEGGNLGMTQLGRVEYALKGGACNTDFIDNAGGVDCSDHEVNIKILLGAVSAAGDITEKQRNQLLATMEDEVAAQVLQNNYRQTQAISIAQSQAKRHMNGYNNYIQNLVSEGRLHRQLEFLPSEEEIKQRKSDGKALTRPELSVLISYSKAQLKDSLVNSGISDDDYLSRQLETAVPGTLVKKHRQALYTHHLKREMIATQTANELVNYMGITFVDKMRTTTKANDEQVVRAFAAARDIYELPSIWQELERLDGQVSSQTQHEMMITVTRVVGHGTHWLLKRHRETGCIGTLVDKYRGSVNQLESQYLSLLQGEAQKNCIDKRDNLISCGVPDSLADKIASIYSGSAHFALDIGEIAETVARPIDYVASVYFLLAHHLDLQWFRRQLNYIKVESRWYIKVRDTFRDDIDRQLSILTQTVLELNSDAPGDAVKRVEWWIEGHKDQLNQWKQMQAEMRHSGESDLAMYAVAIRELMEMGSNQ